MPRASKHLTKAIQSLGGLTRTKPIAWERQGECFIVTSHAKRGDGYFEITRGRKRQLVHRMVCERRHGPLGPLLATHSCDNRSCINPEHLRPGTPAQNVAEMFDRNRPDRMATASRGEQNGYAKLTATQALEIFHATGRSADIGARYGVCESAVLKIKSKRLWRHLWG